ncbi:hypothetical protein CUC08_Gglean013337 [Alternaria sp. MG1]|nr:hypothetical protein CUC08_Gglean013337 [Alternaria sp. MG1]
MGGVLDRFPLEILEVVLDAAVPKRIRRLMYAVLRARLQRFPASLADAKDLARAEGTEGTDDMRPFTLDRVAEAVRSLLATAENVHTWSHACLEHLIQKSMELRPSTLIKKGMCRTRREEFETAESRKDYLPQDTGPPSWVEEQRMIKSFWQLQFFLELQGEGRKGRLGINWPKQEVDVLFQSSAGGFYDVYNCEREQILTACDFLGAVASRTVNSIEAVHENASNLPTIRWVDGAVLRHSCAEPLSFERNKDTFSQGSENLDRTSWAHRFHAAMSSTDGWLEGAPLTIFYPFQIWRKYGFAIWDEKRMVDLGMRHPKKASYLSNSFSYAFRWWSILTEEDLR